MKLDFKYSVLNGKALSPGLTYEAFLMEVINGSRFFRLKVCQEPFHAPESESYGEADAITSQYALDFKLLVDQDEMNSRYKSRPEVDCSHMNKGYISVKTKQGNDPIEYHNILSELLDLKEEAYRAEKYSKSIKALRANCHKAKNLMFFYPYELPSMNGRLSTTFCNVFTEALGFLLAEREETVPCYETYLCLKTKATFWVLGWTGGSFVVCDKVPEILVPTYRDLVTYSFD